MWSARTSTSPEQLFLRQSSRGRLTFTVDYRRVSLTSGAYVMGSITLTNPNAQVGIKRRQGRVNECLKSGRHQTVTCTTHHCTHSQEHATVGFWVTPQILLSEGFVGRGREGRDAHVCGVNTVDACGTAWEQQQSRQVLQDTVVCSCLVGWRKMVVGTHYLTKAHNKHIKHQGNPVQGGVRV